MDTLNKRIRQEISKKGGITFERFMDMCLYEPGLGYYMQGLTEIGKHGDFYTSPHLHAIFGAMVGRQAERMWAFMGKPPEFHVLEMGAGEGHLCADMLGYLKGGEFYEHLSYTVVELNPHMAQKQKQLLKDYKGKVAWAASLNDVEPFAGCVLSNELVDSFPVHLVQMQEELMEVYVTLKGGDFKEELRQADNGLGEYLKEFSIVLPDGYRTEINLHARQWLSDVRDVLKEGFVFTVDYGYPALDYYAEGRSRGTLMCYRGHEALENPYHHAGQTDMTAHVNFSSLKAWGQDLGLQTLGFCPQGTFLVSSGIDEVIVELYGESPDDQPEVNQTSDYQSNIQKIKRLIMPGTMGETHKVLLQYKGPRKPAPLSPVMLGFQMRNQAGNL